MDEFKFQWGHWQNIWQGLFWNVPYLQTVSNKAWHNENAIGLSHPTVLTWHHLFKEHYNNILCCSPFPPSFSRPLLNIKNSTFGCVLCVHSRNFTHIHIKPEIDQTRQSVPKAALASLFQLSFKRWATVQCAAVGPDWWLSNPRS